nr:MAG TPA: hypothetical protein [Caudoviricetes sp.]
MIFSAAARASACAASSRVSNNANKSSSHSLMSRPSSNITFIVPLRQNISSKMQILCGKYM